MEEVKILGSENIFSRATPAPSVAGIIARGGATGKEFKRGQFLYQVVAGATNGDINNTNEGTATRFAGVCVNDVTIAPNETINMDVYTEAFLLGERVFNLQTPQVQTLLRQFATNARFSTPFNMQYHGIKLEISF